MCIRDRTGPFLLSEKHPAFFAYSPQILLKKRLHWAHLFRNIFVYTGMTVEQEALLFAEQNGFSAPLTAGIRQAVDQIKSLALWSKLWSKPNEVSPQTKNPTISNVKSLDLWSSRTGQIRTFSFYPISRQSVLKSDGLGAILVVERD